MRSSTAPHKLRLQLHAAKQPWNLSSSALPDRGKGQMWTNSDLGELVLEVYISFGGVVVTDGYTNILWGRCFPWCTSALTGVRLAIPIESKPLTASCSATSCYITFLTLLHEKYLLTSRRDGWRLKWKSNPINLSYGDVATPGIIKRYHESLYPPKNITEKSNWSQFMQMHRELQLEPPSCCWYIQFQEIYFPTSPKFGDFRSLVGRQQSLRAVDTLQEDAVFPLPFWNPTVSGHFQCPILLIIHGELVFLLLLLSLHVFHHVSGCFHATVTTIVPTWTSPCSLIRVPFDWHRRTVRRPHWSITKACQMNVTSGLQASSFQKCVMTRRTALEWANSVLLSGCWIKWGVSAVGCQIALCLTPLVSGNDWKGMSITYGSKKCTYSCATCFYFNFLFWPFLVETISWQKSLLLPVGLSKLDYLALHVSSITSKWRALTSRVCIAQLRTLMHPRMLRMIRDKHTQCASIVSLHGTANRSALDYSTWQYNASQ